MSDNKKFIWLLDSGAPRSGPALVKGQEHDASKYPAAVVEEWVKTGAAAWVEARTRAARVAAEEIK
jgi:hypothetical protein